MHTRRIASFLIGGWIIGTFLAALLSLQSNGGTDRVLSNPQPEAAQIIKTIGDEHARIFLRAEATEQNRIISETWEWLELAIGIGLTFVLFSTHHVSRFITVMAVIMLGLVVFMRFVLTPEIAYLGLQLDFTPPNRADYGSLNLMRGLYAALDALKILLGFVIAGYLFVYKTKAAGSLRHKVHAVDHADHSHIDG